MDQYIYEAPVVQQESSESAQESHSDDESDEISSIEQCGSDPEDMESGEFFDYI